jgi:CDP-diacylglycerol pyrophosphatase
MIRKTLISSAKPTRPSHDRSCNHIAHSLATALAVISSLFMSSLYARADVSQRWSDQLWNVVGGLCLPTHAIGVTWPCITVDPGREIAVLRVAPSHLLAVPTRKLAGIESAALLQPSSPNYWQAAWEAQSFLTSGSHRLRRSEIGIAVNSMKGRSQDQLHLHLRCIRKAVRSTLDRHASKITRNWRWLRIDSFAHPYRVRWLAGEDLNGRDPFKILAGDLASARRHMGDQTLVVVGAESTEGMPGFYLLNRESQPKAPASGEELLATCGR